MSSDVPGQKNDEQERIQQIAHDFFTVMSQLEKEERDIIAAAMKELDRRHIAEIHKQLNTSYEHGTTQSN